MEIKLDFRVGLMQPSFLQQARKMKLLFDKDVVKKLQRHRENILFLEFDGIITEKLATNAHRKVVGRLIAHLVKKNKLKKIPRITN